MGYNALLMSKFRLFLHLLSLVVSGKASHFLETTMLISKVGALIQTRMRVGSITFPIMGPMRGQYVFLMTKSIFFFIFFFFEYYYFG